MESLPFILSLEKRRYENRFIQNSKCEGTEGLSHLSKVHKKEQQIPRKISLYIDANEVNKW